MARVPVDPSMIELGVNWQESKNVFETRIFLGLIGYYHRFTLDFSRLAAFMTWLTCKGLIFGLR